MHSLLKTLIRSKRFQHTTGILRGLDLVKLGFFETRSTYKNYRRIYRGDTDDDDEIFEKNTGGYTINSNLGKNFNETIQSIMPIQEETVTVKETTSRKSSQQLNEQKNKSYNLAAESQSNQKNIKTKDSEKFVNNKPSDITKDDAKRGIAGDISNNTTTSNIIDRKEINFESGSFKRDSGPENWTSNIKDENLDAIRAGETYQNTLNEQPLRDIKVEKTVGRENPVPASSLSRAYNIAGLGFSLLSSAASVSIQNLFSSEKVSRRDVLLSDENAKKIGDFLCRMRGAPLKLGQELSMQEDALIPKQIKAALERAQRSADIMPVAQLTKMLDSELGEGWEEKYTYFDKNPMAAASIGQVHFATTKKGMDVAVKIQYPGVAESIDSDLNNIKRLMKYTNILPKQLFMDDIIKNARIELNEECDYVKEAQKQFKFREFIKGMPNYYTPVIDTELSTSRILTIEYVKGLSMDQLESQSQDVRDRAGELIFTIILKQLFNFRFMQTDPNPANFFYNLEKDILYLIDFGAAREFSQEFVSTYLDIVYGASVKDREVVWECSKKLGFLTGEENREMREAHVNSVLVVGEPFSLQRPFDFGNQNLTDRIYKYMPIMLKNRLKAPPPEVYSLHRILSGAYLMCMKLKSRVQVGQIFDAIYKEAIRIQ